MYDIRGASEDIARLRAANASMRDIIDRSLDHLREMYAFLHTLEPEPVRPIMYIDGHPVCCGVPMWLTKVSLSDVSCAEYTCQVCGHRMAELDRPGRPINFARASAG